MENTPRIHYVKCPPCCRRNVKHAAADSTGFDTHHVSRYFIWRRDNDRSKGENRPKKRHSYKRYGKLMLIVSFAYAYFFFNDYIVQWYGGDDAGARDLRGDLGRTGYRLASSGSIPSRAGYLAGVPVRIAF